MGTARSQDNEKKSTNNKKPQQKKKPTNTHKKKKKKNNSEGVVNNLLNNEEGSRRIKAPSFTPATSQKRVGDQWPTRERATFEASANGDTLEKLLIRIRGGEKEGNSAGKAAAHPNIREKSEVRGRLEHRCPGQNRSQKGGERVYWSGVRIVREGKQGYLFTVMRPGLGEPERPCVRNGYISRQGKGKKPLPIKSPALRETWAGAGIVKNSNFLVIQSQEQGRLKPKIALISGGGVVTSEFGLPGQAEKTKGPHLQRNLTTKKTNAR